MQIAKISFKILSIIFKIEIKKKILYFNNFFCLTYI